MWQNLSGWIKQRFASNYAAQLSKPLNLLVSLGLYFLQTLIKIYCRWVLRNYRKILCCSNSISALWWCCCNFFFCLLQQEAFSPAQDGLILFYKCKEKKIIGLSGIAKGWSTKKLYMNKRDLNHTCNCRHSFSCCAKSPDIIISPRIILLWGLMVTNCPVYQNKTVLCNLASLLLCIHQYIRS